MICAFMASSVVMLFRGGAALSSVAVDQVLTKASEDFYDDVFASGPGLRFESGARPSNTAKLVSIACPSGKTIMLPGNGILLERGEKRILWCPNAKAGTSSVFRTFAYLAGEQAVTNGEARADGRQTSIRNIIQSGHEKKLCDRIPFSFIVMRNPWDRIRSAYLDKVNRVVFVPGHRHASFHQFLHAISKSSPAAMNAHWQPASHRCVTAGPNRFNYTKMYKLEEHFEESLAEAFAHLGITKRRTREAIKKLGRQNVGESDHTIESRLTAYKDPDTMKIMQEIYHDDIEGGGYEFNSF
jgi:hypothetical protein